jgi:hypothetical protein
VRRGDGGIIEKGPANRNGNGKKDFGEKCPDAVKEWIRKAG